MTHNAYDAAYLDKAAQMVSQDGSRSTRQKRVDYFLNKLSMDPQFQDNSIAFLSRVHRIMEETKHEQSGEQAANAFQFLSRAHDRLNTESNAEKLHRLHTQEALEETARHVCSDPKAHNIFLVSAAKGYTQKLSA